MNVCVDWVAAFLAFPYAFQLILVSNRSGSTCNFSPKRSTISLCVIWSYIDFRICEITIEPWHLIVPNPIYVEENLQFIFEQSVLARSFSLYHPFCNSAIPGSGVTRRSVHF